jgi:hypothetical protein
MTLLAALQCDVIDPRGMLDQPFTAKAAAIMSSSVSCRRSRPATSSLWIIPAAAGDLLSAGQSAAPEAMLLLLPP